MLISSHIINRGINVILPSYNLIFILSPNSTIWRTLKSQPIEVNFSQSRGSLNLFPWLHKTFIWHLECHGVGRRGHLMPSAHTGPPRDPHPTWAPLPVRTGRLLLHITLWVHWALSSSCHSWIQQNIFCHCHYTFIPHSQWPKYFMHQPQLYCQACCFPQIPSQSKWLPLSDLQTLTKHKALLHRHAGIHRLPPVNSFSS